ncbi:hypothetical protein EDD53_0365 [Pacificibacter maritimus]|uniref:SnoaL-like protein n=1 Tax=Pacificibacter maritimus TaxID=762213 RepID=A0A3N4UUT3_9RHOB|nr:hypothetical protein [Pacificibacter maritimus]RPE71249.1 hypothetical protein EDD53_0365 [Pacificibacter maritimus]
MEDAVRIAQDFLDRQGEATMSGDLEATLGWCNIPCTLENSQGHTVARTEAEMRAICKMFIDTLKAKRLTHMVRHCVEAMFTDKDTICAAYETRYIKERHQLAEDSYAGFVVLRRGDDRWKISNMQFAGDNDSPVDITLRDWARDRVNA